MWQFAEFAKKKRNCIIDPKKVATMKDLPKDTISEFRPMFWTTCEGKLPFSKILYQNKKNLNSEGFNKTIFFSKILLSGSP